MKAMVYTEYGSADALKLQEITKPEPKDNEVLIRVRACSVNDWDWGLLRGDLVNRCINGLSRPKKFQILGSDIAGEVEAVGSKISLLCVGDKVFGDLSGHHFGGFAEYVCVPETKVVRMPAGMTFIHAAAISQAGVLATQALLDSGKVSPGQKVLMNGAGGGVGTLGIQVLKAIGNIEVTGVDSGIKLPMLRELGFNHVIDYTQSDFTAGDVQYDLIVDAKTNRSPTRYLRALKPNGIYATVGGQLGRLAQLALLAPMINLFSSKKLKVVGLKPNKDLPHYSKLFEQGKLAPVIDGPYPLEELPRVFDLYAQGLQKGKMVISI
jgi:NADPH:quinone reductase-like Zn-dependent oxidoreductase